MQSEVRAQVVLVSANGDPEPLGAEVRSQPCVDLEPGTFPVLSTDDCANSACGSSTPPR